MRRRSKSSFLIVVILPILFKLQLLLITAFLFGVKGISGTPAQCIVGCKRTGNPLPRGFLSSGSTGCPALFQSLQTTPSRLSGWLYGGDDSSERRLDRWRFLSRRTWKKRPKCQSFWYVLFLCSCPLTSSHSHLYPGVCKVKLSSSPRKPLSTLPVADALASFLPPVSLSPSDLNLSRRADAATRGESEGFIRGLPTGHSAAVPPGLVRAEEEELQNEYGASASRERGTVGKKGEKETGCEAKERGEHELGRIPDAFRNGNQGTASTSGHGGAEQKLSDFRECLVKELLSDLFIAQVPHSRLILLRLPSKTENRHLYQGDVEVQHGPSEEETNTNSGDKGESASRQAEADGKGPEGRRQRVETGDAFSPLTVAVAEPRHEGGEATGEEDGTQEHGGERKEEMGNGKETGPATMCFVPRTVSHQRGHGYSRGETNSPEILVLRSSPAITSINDSTSGQEPHCSDGASSLPASPHLPGISSPFRGLLPPRVTMGTLWLHGLRNALLSECMAQGKLQQSVTTLASVHRVEDESVREICAKGGDFNGTMQEDSAHVPLSPGKRRPVLQKSFHIRQDSQPASALTVGVCNPSLLRFSDRDTIIVAPVSRTHISSSFTSIRRRRRRPFKGEPCATGGHVWRTNSGTRFLDPHCVQTGCLGNDSVHGAKLEELMQLLSAWWRKHSEGQGLAEERNLYVALWLLPEHTVGPRPESSSQGGDWSHDEVEEVQQWAERVCNVAAFSTSLLVVPEEQQTDGLKKHKRAGVSAHEASTQRSTELCELSLTHSAIEEQSDHTDGFSFLKHLQSPVEKTQEDVLPPVRGLRESTMTYQRAAALLCCFPEAAHKILNRSSLALCWRAREDARRQYPVDRFGRRRRLVELRKQIVSRISPEMSRVVPPAEPPVGCRPGNEQAGETLSEVICATQQQRRTGSSSLRVPGLRPYLGSGPPRPTQAQSENPDEALEVAGSFCQTDEPDSSDRSCRLHDVSTSETPQASAAFSAPQTARPQSVEDLRFLRLLEESEASRELKRQARRLSSSDRRTRIQQQSAILLHAYYVQRFAARRMPVASDHRRCCAGYGAAPEGPAAAGYEIDRSSAEGTPAENGLKREEWRAEGGAVETGDTESRIFCTTRRAVNKETSSLHSVPSASDWGSDLMWDKLKSSVPVELVRQHEQVRHAARLLTALRARLQNEHPVLGVSDQNGFYLSRWSNTVRRFLALHLKRNLGTRESVERQARLLDERFGRSRENPIKSMWRFQRVVAAAAGMQALRASPLLASHNPCCRSTSKERLSCTFDLSPRRLAPSSQNHAFPSGTNVRTASLSTGSRVIPSLSSPGSQPALFAGRVRDKMKLSRLVDAWLVACMHLEVPNALWLLTVLQNEVLLCLESPSALAAALYAVTELPYLHSGTKHLRATMRKCVLRCTHAGESPDGLRRNWTTERMTRRQKDRARQAGRSLESHFIGGESASPGERAFGQLSRELRAILSILARERAAFLRLQAKHGVLLPAPLASSRAVGALEALITSDQLQREQAPPFALRERCSDPTQASPTGSTIFPRMPSTANDVPWRTKYRNPSEVVSRTDGYDTERASRSTPSCCAKRRELGESYSGAPDFASTAIPVRWTLLIEMLRHAYEVLAQVTMIPSGVAVTESMKVKARAAAEAVGERLSQLGAPR
ncbi:hypothetical protein CSUI_006743 [Cystoisospora suis]|uniref:Transmembrane protein n=1 Tax=Cystoisospora suis TaxID=483139 RepID=A0A2C6KSG0_9APIC|nr:hypothetical protein CSUI_006743 [Cystoisospora suis]